MEFSNQFLQSEKLTKITMLEEKKIYNIDNKPNKSIVEMTKHYAKTSRQKKKKKSLEKRIQTKNEITIFE